MRLTTTTQQAVENRPAKRLLLEVRWVEWNAAQHSDFVGLGCCWGKPNLDFGVTTLFA